MRFALNVGKLRFGRRVVEFNYASSNRSLTTIDLHEVYIQVTRSIEPDDKFVSCTVLLVLTCLSHGKLSANT